MRIVLIVLTVGLLACGAQPARTATPRDARHGAMGELVGPTTREEIESELPAWAEARTSATIDADATARLGTVAPGAEVTVYLGTWCGDSRREVSRLFAALDRAGTLPFSIRFVAVDRAKQAPGYTEDAGLLYVPTIVVVRDGREVGRIIESAPLGVERSLLELLDGTRTGIVSGRPGVQPAT